MRQAVAWNERIEEVRALGYDIAFVTYDPRDTLARFAERRAIAYTLLSDPDAAVIRAFGVLNEAYPPGSRWHGVAEPTAFVVDAEGIVRHRLAGQGGSSHPAVEAVLEALRREAGG